MIAYVAVVAIQVALVVHMVRTGRNTLWLAALIFLPVVGSIAYVIVEILPGLAGNRHVRTARAKAVAALDPERELRAARDSLDLADTVANKVRLGDAYAELGRWGEAEAAYRDARGGAPGDAAIARRIARALFEQGHAAEALALIDALDPPSVQAERDRFSLLRARVLEHLGRAQAALDIYADIVTRLPGEEARCRYAALLLAEGRQNKAREQLEEVEARARRLDRGRRAAEADMYRWAAETLAQLRARER